MPSLNKNCSVLLLRKVMRHLFFCVCLGRRFTPEIPPTAPDKIQRRAVVMNFVPKIASVDVTDAVIKIISMYKSPDTAPVIIPRLPARLAGKNPARNAPINFTVEEITGMDSSGSGV